VPENTTSESTSTSSATGTARVKRGMAEMLKVDGLIAQFGQKSKPYGVAKASRLGRG
jgi:hypothetical protein